VPALSPPNVTPRVLYNVVTGFELSLVAVFSSKVIVAAFETALAMVNVKRQARARQHSVFLFFIQYFSMAVLLHLSISFCLSSAISLEQRPSHFLNQLK